ncbi:ThiF family adenylyltransferase [Labedella endophytica]|uniref:Molybdopterin biosynthesis protein MoeB n=1 Tax=Labedella endophytica TaxID=1523160 RepID=A0A433JRX2_9MICO|nr:ThiF family adenylyltransferase [Labedella endophytica]RUR00930.1 molybdopterin biosynthesis protein MoeB [Labedella endophytica]
MPDSSRFARFARQIALPGFGVAGQDRLADARVLVIGAGGLGSTVIPTLAGAGVGTIGIIDDDRVETSNLHRQLVHGTSDVGRAKVDSAADRVAAIAPDVEVVRHAERLSSAIALDLFATYDLVLDGSDNFPTRYLANDAAVLTDVPLVWGAVSQFGGQVGVSWASRGPQYRDLFPSPPPPGSVLSCAVGGVLPTTVGVVGSLMASEAIKILTGIGDPLIGRVTVFDGLVGTFRELGYAADPEAEPVTGLIDYDLFCGIAAVGTESGSPEPDADTIDAPTLASLGDSVTLVDVREDWEAEIAAIPRATLIPLGDLPERIGEVDTSRPVVLHCHHGIRSATALRILADAGVTARHLDGGIDAWSRLVDPTIVRY